MIPGHCSRGPLSDRSRRVLQRAAELAELRTPRAVVFTGGCHRSARSEAELMLDAWPGRDDVELALETTATTTAENASRTLPLLLARDIGEATVVCVPVHSRRVRYFFVRLYERFGVRCAVSVAPSRPTLSAVAWELGATAVMSRQRRSAFAELESPRG